LSALSEPNRLRIVELLREGPLSVGEIADRLGLNHPQASKHLRVLSDAGIVEVHAIANRRIYKLRPEPFKDWTLGWSPTTISGKGDSTACKTICGNCKKGGEP